MVRTVRSDSQQRSAFGGQLPPSRPAPGTLRAEGGLRDIPRAKRRYRRTIWRWRGHVVFCHHAITAKGSEFSPVPKKGTARCIWVLKFARCSFIGAHEDTSVNGWVPHENRIKNQHLTREA